MKKKILAILMATLTVGSLLSGCGGAQSSDANGNQESSKQRQRRTGRGCICVHDAEQYPGVIRTGKNSEPDQRLYSR